MSGNNSINGNKEPYTRQEAWIKGIRNQPPLFENVPEKVQKRILAAFADSRPWTTRPEDFRSVNGYPE
jgi:hypothetical protein